MALSIPSKEKASTEGKFAAAVIDCGPPPREGPADAGRALSILEYVLTTTGWDVMEVFELVDFVAR